ncbi:MAG: helix-turn-helix domain-containing protein [Minisyncoccia bacterium]
MNELFESLDLNESEAAVFKTILERGPMTPVALAKAAGVKRTTAYSIARSLSEKGLLIEDTTRRPRTFAPAAPEQVLALIESDKKRIVEREKSLVRLAEELSKASLKENYPVPTVRFIEEGKMRDFYYKQMPVWDASMLATKESTWWGFQDHTFVEEFSSWITDYWKQAPEVIDLKLLSNRAEAEVKFAPSVTPRRAIKFWGEATNFLSTTWAIGDYLVMINTRTRPFYLVEIHDKLIAHDQREVFRNLWPLVS